MEVKKDHIKYPKLQINQGLQAQGIQILQLTKKRYIHTLLIVDLDQYYTYKYNLIKKCTYKNK